MSVALAPARRPRRLVIPAVRRTPRETLVATLPFFLRGGSGPAAPRPLPILAFEGAEFLDAFQAAVADPAKLPVQLAWRDWAEPPDGVLTGAGAPRYDATRVKRAAPLPALPTGEPGLAADGVPQGSPAWFRKLYLPRHGRFHLVAFDLLCEAAGWPRVARGRVLAAGAVIRRLRPDPARPRWEDWLSADGRRGVWIELGEPLETAGDPDALNDAAMGSLETALMARLGLARRKDIPRRLASAKLALLAPDAAGGEAASHCTVQGYVPLQSSAELAGPAPVTDPALVKERLKVDAKRVTDALVGGAAPLALGVRTPLAALLDATLGIARPSDADHAAALASARAHPAEFAPFDPLPVATADARIARTLEAALGTLLREGLAVLNDADADLAAIDVGGPDGVNAWWDAAFSRVFAEAAGGDLARDFDSAWGAGNLRARQSAWRVLLARRLHEAVAAVKAQSSAPAPLPGQPSGFDQTKRDLLLGCALLRLRLLRLGLAASLRRQMFGAGGFAESLVAREGGIPAATAGALGLEIEAALGLEATRSASNPLPWPALGLSLPGVGTGAIDAHRAGAQLTKVFEDFETAASEAGAAFETAQEARIAERALALAQSLVPPVDPLHPAAQSLALDRFRALGLEWREQPARGLLAQPGPAPSAALLGVLAASLQARYDSEAAALGEARAESTLPRPRFDDSSLYCIQAWVRVAGRDACEREQIVWTAPSEPFSIAEPNDLLGAQPATIALPDIPRLIRDIPRIEKAKARPWAGFPAKPGSAYITGEKPEDTRLAFGIGSICSFAIPVLTICAYILFSIIFSILIIIPGFAWMLFLKFCLPIPVVKKP
jgi:hypothetical protein